MRFLGTSIYRGGWDWCFSASLLTPGIGGASEPFLMGCLSPRQFIRSSSQAAPSLKWVGRQGHADPALSQGRYSLRAFGIGTCSDPDHFVGSLPADSKLDLILGSGSSGPASILNLYSMTIFPNFYWCRSHNSSCSSTHLPDKHVC